MKKMSRTDIPDFIKVVSPDACPTAVRDGYIIGQGGYCPQKPRDGADDVHEQYDSKDSVLAELARYLRSIGRAYQLPSIH